MKSLNGSELAGYIKQRQAKQVRSLKQGQGIQPKLTIIKTKDDPVINTYLRLKRKYGEEIGVEVDVLDIDQVDIVNEIKRLNADTTVSGMIVQLPLRDPAPANDILNQVAPEKDVDGLGDGSSFVPATPQAIEWLLDGYNIDLNGKKIMLIGRGRLVGAPLYDLFKQRNLDVSTHGRDIELNVELKQADVLVSATGVAGLIKADMLKPNAVAVDAGVATAGAKTVGDFSDDVYERDDLTVTPKRGGVGPLTVCALFENVILATSGELG